MQWKYDVIIIVIGLTTTALTIGAPVIKLNTAITRLIVKLDSLGKDMEDMEQHNHESHKRIWDKNGEQRTENRMRSWPIMRPGFRS